MTLDEIAAETMGSFRSGDIEHDHINADALLLALLEKEYPLTVEAFRNLKKWYA